MAKEIKTGALISHVLKQEGVKYIFGLPGGHIYPTMEEAEKLGIKFIGTRDEAAAAYAAEGWALATGDLVIRKVVTGDQAPANATFNFTLDVKVTLPEKTLTADEAKMVGGTSDLNKLYYLYSGERYYTSSPYGDVPVGVPVVYYVESNGRITGSPFDAYGTRPVINLKSDVVYCSGDGTASNPYIIGLKDGKGGTTCSS